MTPFTMFGVHHDSSVATGGNQVVIVVGGDKRFSMRLSR